MNLFAFALLLVFVCGPLRRLFFANWTFLLPAIVGGVCAWRFMNGALPFAVPRWMVSAAVLIAAIGIGINAKQFLDSVFRRRD